MPRQSLKIVGIGLLAASVVAGVGSVVAERGYASRAKLYQLVRPSEEAALFGEVGELVGSPQLFVVDDARAVLPQKGADGVALLDDTYLRENGIYPLQMQSVSAVAKYIRLGAGAAAFLGAGALLAARRSQKGAQAALA